MRAWLLHLALLSPGSAGSLEPHPTGQASGLDLLYSDRIVINADGVPLVPIGVAQKQPIVTLSSDRGLTLEFYEDETFKRLSVPPNDTVRFKVVRHEPAQTIHEVVLEEVPWGDKKALRTSLERWRQQGLTQTRAVEEGTVVGLGGQILDNRAYRLVFPVANSRQARTRAIELFRQHGTLTVARARLKEKPWGHIRITSNRAPLATATTFVRILSAQPPIQLRTRKDGATRPYEGHLYVSVDAQGALAVTNVLELERVLLGVVPSELFGSAPLEALKAQAVAARNQILVKLSRRHHADPFHLCNEQHCQVYTGQARHHPRASEAVRATAGHVLFHRGRLVDTVYSSTCGGHTENNDAVWGQPPSPALRGRPDLVRPPPWPVASAGIPVAQLPDWFKRQPEAYCRQNKHVNLDRFRWHRAFSRAQIEKHLRKRFADFTTLDAIRVRQRGPGGRVIVLEVKDTQGWRPILRELPIRRLFDGLHSGAFVLDVARTTTGIKTVTFRGGGWGHGSGMCQLGAVGRAEAGFHYRDILSHYYNGAEVRALY